MRVIVNTKMNIVESICTLVTAKKYITYKHVSVSSSWVKIICKDDKAKKKFQLRSRQVLASFHQELLDILSL